MMGIRISVFRNGRDCSNGGLSSRFTNLTVVNASGPFEPDEDAPAVVVQSHVQGCLRIVPAMMVDVGEWVGAPGAFMMGGNYGATSDSRFTQLCERLLGHTFYGAVAIHDRQEF
jgi:hypothetical protein